VREREKEKAFFSFSKAQVAKENGDGKKGNGIKN
jgi:hypothetical protein